MIRRIDCDNCHSSGVVECRYCQGEGVDTEGKTCSNCGGAGADDCPVCNGRGFVEVEIDDEYANMGY